MVRRVVLLLFVVWVAASCGDDGESATVDPASTVAATSTEAPTSTEVSTSTAPEPSTSAVPSSTTTTTPPTTSASTEPTMPGEPFDGFVAEGDVVGVMGVAHDDVLNVREGPGTDQSIVARAAPTAVDVVATGQARSLPSSIWYEVTVDGSTGWASAAFLAFIGATDDATAEFLDGQPLPEAETMVGLADLVAAGFASQDPPSLIVQSVAPTVGDLGEITYDVVGLGDDAVGGYRLHIFATPTDSGDSFVLKSIERTYFCTRGATGGLCA